MKKCRFYYLRGSYATRILNNGIELREVADILGHKDVETTENFYISSMDEAKNMQHKYLVQVMKLDIIYEIVKYDL